MNGPATRPAIDAVFTMWPAACCIRIGTNARIPWITPQRLTPSTHSQVSTWRLPRQSARADTGVVAHDVDAAEPRRPSASASACTCAASVTSVTTPSTSTPAASRFATAASSAARFDVADDDLHAFARAKRRGEREADPARAAGDDRDLAVRSPAWRCSTSTPCRFAEPATSTGSARACTGPRRARRCTRPAPRSAS